MIRLSRVGKKKKAEYRIIIQEKSKDPWGDFLEFLGTYNPHTKKVEVKQERVKYWMSVGAKLSVTLNNLFIRHKIIKGKKIKASKYAKKGAPAKENKEASKQEQVKAAIPETMKANSATAEPKNENKDGNKAEEKKTEKQDEHKEDEPRDK